MQSVRYSDESGFWVSGFQIITFFTFSPKGLHQFQKRTCTVLISFIGTLPETLPEEEQKYIAKN